MKISPPIAVLIILALGVVTASWLAPLPRLEPTVNIALATGTYKKLAQWGDGEQGADGATLSVTEVIEIFAAHLPHVDKKAPKAAGAKTK